MAANGRLLQQAPALNPPPLACSVRGCARPLARRGPTFECPRGHAFDVARRGYVNLLQPQDRHSPAPGDSKEAVAARARLLDAGVGHHILEVVVDRASALVASDGVVVDLGSGSGDALAQLVSRQALTAVGIDLSSAAVEHAARRFPQITWVVANADRRLPLLDHSVSLILSLHARRNAAECLRTLSPQGWLVAAVPGSDDLVELREAVQGMRVERARAELFLEEHAALFELAERFVVREKHTLGRDALRDLLRGTYRGARASAAGRIEELTALDVTLSSEVLVLRTRAHHSLP